MLDEAKVDCLELAIPFPNSASDGPVIRASASRALEDGVDRDAVLEFIRDVRPELEPPEDRAARRLELLDQGHADARVP